MNERKEQAEENADISRKYRAFQGVLSNDKSVICLPRQQTNIFEKTLIYKGI